LDIVVEVEATDRRTTAVKQMAVNNINTRIYCLSRISQQIKGNVDDHRYIVATAIRPI
jgi:hypothetical protein